MLLVDTSVWVDHLRRGNAQLRALIEAGAVATHPIVIGELACGSLGERGRVLGWLRRLPTLAQLPDPVVYEAIEARRWWGRGIEWADAHLLAAALAAGLPLWTLDRHLARLADPRAEPRWP